MKGYWMRSLTSSVNCKNEDGLGTAREKEKSMQIIRQLLAEPLTLVPCIVTLGTFDGVHRGHQYLFQKVLRMAKRLKKPAGLLTFSNHPSEVLRPEQPTLKLTGDAQKLALLQPFAFDFIIDLEFTQALCNFTAEHFLTSLRRMLPFEWIIVGPDVTFGKYRQGTAQFLKDYAQKEGFSVEIIEPYASDNERISSTLVRDYIEQGDLEKAAALLGREYSLWSRVVAVISNYLYRIDVSGLVIPKEGAYSVIIAKLGSGKYYRGSVRNETADILTVTLDEPNTFLKDMAIELCFEGLIAASYEVI
jgi:riboflavin kinase/FMN adenylyltransferase